MEWKATDKHHLPYAQVDCEFSSRGSAAWCILLALNQFGRIKEMGTAKRYISKVPLYLCETRKQKDQKN